MQELRDLSEALDWLKTRPYVDGARIGISGHSFGGFLAAYALCHSTLFAAGIAGAPVTDWRNYDSIYTERYMGLPEENRDGYRESSPIGKAENLKAKLMIVHNFEDDNVLFQNSMQMINALEQAGKEFEFMLYPQKTHGVTGPLSRQMESSMLDFFDRNLK